MISHLEQQSDLPSPSTAQRVWVAAGFVVIACGTAFLFSKTLPVLLLVFAGVVLGVFLSGLTSLWLRAMPMRRWQALGVVTLTLVALAALAGRLAAPGIATQIKELADDLPKVREEFAASMQSNDLGKLVYDQLPDLSGPANDEMMRHALGIFSTSAGVVIGALFVLITGFFFALEPDLYKHVILLLPPVRRKRMGEVFDEAGVVLWRWFIGRLVGVVIIGAGWVLGLWLMGVKSAITLGVLAGALEFVPLLGPTLALGPALLIGLVNGGPQTAAGVLGFYLVLQAVESYLVTPLIERQAVVLPPVLTLASQLVLGVWAGALGVLLAPPLVAVILVFVRRLYVEDVLGDVKSADLGAPDECKTHTPPNAPAEHREVPDPEDTHAVPAGR